MQVQCVCVFVGVELWLQSLYLGRYSARFINSPSCPVLRLLWHLSRCGPPHQRPPADCSYASLSSQWTCSAAARSSRHSDDPDTPRQWSAKISNWLVMGFLYDCLHNLRQSRRHHVASVLIYPNSRWAHCAVDPARTNASTRHETWRPTCADSYRRNYIIIHWIYLEGGAQLTRDNCAHRQTRVDRDQSDVQRSRYDVADSDRARIWAGSVSGDVDAWARHVCVPHCLHRWQCYCCQCQRRCCCLHCPRCPPMPCPASCCCCWRVCCPSAAAAIRCRWTTWVPQWQHRSCWPPTGGEDYAPMHRLHDAPVLAENGVAERREEESTH